MKDKFDLQGNAFITIALSILTGISIRHYFDTSYMSAIVNLLFIILFVFLFSVWFTIIYKICSESKIGGHRR